MMVTKQPLLSLCLVLLLESVLSAVIHSNITVSLEDFNGQQVTIPQVDGVRFDCTGESGLSNLRWSVSGDSMNCSQENGSDNYYCAPESMSSSVVACSSSSAQKDNITRSVNITIDNDVTVFVGSDFRYRSQMTSRALQLTAEKAEPVNIAVTMTCVPLSNNLANPVVTWMYRRTQHPSNRTIMAGDFEGATVSFANVSGSNGVAVNGQLTLSRQTSGMAGHYECTIARTNETFVETLYWGPYFNEFNFVNASAIEGYNAVMSCNGLTYPQYPVKWERCVGEGDSCYPCNNSEPISHGGRFELSDEGGYPANTLIIKGVNFEDRRCYKCFVGNSVTNRTHRIFLRVRDDLQVLWPILILIVEGFIVVLFIVGHILYQRLRDRRKPPKRSANEPGVDLHNLLPQESSSVPKNTVNDGSYAVRKRTDITSTSSLKEMQSSDL